MSIVNDIFTQVTFDGEDRQYHHELYNKIKALAFDIDQHTPDCQDKTLALRALHLALMHTGCSLSKKLKYK